MAGDINKISCFVVIIVVVMTIDSIVIVDIIVINIVMTITIVIVMMMIRRSGDGDNGDGDHMSKGWMECKSEIRLSSKSFVYHFYFQSKNIHDRFKFISIFQVAHPSPSFALFLFMIVMDHNLESQQNSVKSNKCNQCDFASYYASALKTHLKTHSGEKSNKCNQCDYASYYASALKTHLKMHSGEKPNKCNLYDYASIKASNFRTHLKMHS